MPVLIYPFNIQDGDDIDAGPVMADFQAIAAITNGALEAGVNIQVAAPSPLDGVAGQGNSLALSPSDHKHLVQSFEQISGGADPSTSLKVGRCYVDTDNLRLRMCVNTSGAGTWITIGNVQAADLPNHAVRHKTGGVDALVANSIDSTMMARTITSGVPASDVSPGAQNAWTDVITGVAPVITNTQIATIIVNVGWQCKSASAAGLVAFRVMNGATLVAQTGQMQTSVQGGANDQQHGTFVWPAQFTSSPTLKLQVNTVSFSTALTVNKAQTINGSVGAPTRMDVIVG